MDPSTEAQPPGPAAPALPAPRDRSIDVAKGIAIILIVFGHVWRGLRSAGLLPVDRDVYLAVDTAVYAVHLPVFAFLAGLFVRRGVERRGATAYVLRRTTDLLWLYVLWTTLQGLVRLATAASTNHALTVDDFFLSFLVKDSQLWFLPFLVVASAFVVAVQPWRSRARAVLAVLATSVPALALWGEELTWVGLAGAQLLPFFLAGTLLGPERLRGLAQGAARWAVLLTCGIVLVVSLRVTLVATPTWAALPPTPGRVAAGVLAAVAGTGSVLSLAQCVGSARLLDLLGRRSLEIFLAHILATAGLRIALVSMGVVNGWVHLALAMVVGLAFPLALHALSTRGPLRVLFAAPWAAGRS